MRPWEVDLDSISIRMVSFPGIEVELQLASHSLRNQTLLELRVFDADVLRLNALPFGVAELELECLRRAANGVAVDLRIVAAGVTPGAWGWLRGCILLPDGLSMQLNAAELEAVLSHEIAHVRRRDNLIAAAAHAITSVFWFHPLVWWIERRMLVEREAACDEMVLARGASAQDYAAGILKVCQAGFAGAAGYAGVTGSNLGNRMEYIMSLNPNRRPSAAARALLAACFTIAVMLPVAGGYLKAQENRPPESGAFTEQFKRDRKSVV